MQGLAEGTLDFGKAVPVRGSIPGPEVFSPRQTPRFLAARDCLLPGCRAGQFLMQLRVSLKRAGP